MTIEIFEEFINQYNGTLTKINTVYQKSLKSLPYICVVASSGMGKTQLAFTLQGDRPYYYMLGSYDISQIIYNNFASISDAFQNVVYKDHPENEISEDIIQTLDFTRAKNCGLMD
ncbi:hypothetical protein THRCLA_22757 [Thraustotheca clavata]|uniref:Crinkler (CRN) family protein n=1 Tax=Thraustotheca clavata TaxID=74557 RepID=A0A1V9YTS6_9STRA|nr:hypothetical protein THRCLA_22757 [Thraustotheca clavata]